MSPNFRSEYLPQTAYYLARIEQISGSPGTPGSKNLYWCSIHLDPSANKMGVLIVHRAGFTLTEKASIGEGVEERAKKCGLPLERVKNLIEKGIDALLPPKQSTPPARP
jgi:hypothetical protein